VAEEKDNQQAGPAEPPVESRQEPAAGVAQPPAGAQPPGPQPQPPIAPAPGGNWRGRARGWTGRKPVQLLAAGVAGAIIGGGVVALLDVLDDHGDRTMLVRVERPGMGPYGPGWRRWQGPEWDDRGDGFPPGWERRRPFAPFPPEKMPQAPRQVPSASPSS
jgi:hypothetical protein